MGRRNGHRHKLGGGYASHRARWTSSTARQGLTTVRQAVQGDAVSQRRLAAVLLSPAVALPLGLLVLHLVCLTQYGFFRDELYYLACAKALAWGYVDHPPFSVALLAAVTSVFGDALAVVRAPVVLAGAGTVAMCVLTARRIGATGWALWLAGLCPALAGMYLVGFHMYTMNGLEIFLWSCVAYVVADGLEEPRTGHWVWLGILLGIALLNKYSALWMIGGLFVGLVLSPRRSLLATPGPWAALGLAALIFSPHVAWQVAHGWPTLEFARNSQDLKLLPVPPLEFLAQQAVVMNIATVPVLVAGVVMGAAGRLGERGRVMTWVFLTVVAILLVNGRSRVNYLAPAYAFLIPVAALAAQRLLAGRRLSPTWVLAPVTASGLVTLPLGLPLLPVDTLTQIATLSPVQPPAEQKGERAPIQGYADMFGWPELAQEVSRVYLSLPEEDRRRVVVIAHNYGEAAALRYFASQIPLPPSISGHNQFWLWGPGAWDGSVAIVLNEHQSELAGRFESFEPVGRVNAPHAMPEQDGSPVWLARGLREPVPEFWLTMRRYF